GEIAAELPRTWLFIGVWLVGGLYALLGTISVAELAAMIPRSGGFYIFARHTFGPYAGFVIGWSDWLSTCGTTAAVALVIGEYTTALFPALDGFDVYVAVFATTAFALLQWHGVRWGGRTQEITSSLKALAFLALIAACFILGRGNAVTSNVAQSASTNALVSFALFSGIIKALQGVIYTYDGWYNLIYFGEEVREPERNIARSMIGSIVLVIAIYVMVNLALVYVLPLSEIAGRKLAVGAAANAIFGNYGGKIIAALATVSMLSTVNANNLIAPRILFAMSRDRLFSEKAVRVNRGGTPTVTLFVSTLAAVLFIVFSQKLENVFAVLGFFFVINYGITFLSVFVLRRREPERPRPFRAWGYPFTTGLVLLGSIAFLVGAFMEDPQHGIYVLALLAASYPAFLLLRLIHKNVEK
ncbi:MAG: APC family permease, partial [Acidobacteriota bacterium]|nr:APC family permease [Acidobacteriota bacterium]